MMFWQSSKALFFSISVLAAISISKSTEDDDDDYSNNNNNATWWSLLRGAWRTNKK
jgi:hypothetical protein